MRMIAVVFFLLGVSAQSFSADPNTIRLLRFNEFEPYLHQNTDTVYVLNFWATWCGPCRKELPEFEKIHQDLNGQKVKIILVSLDFPSQKKTLQNYIKSNNITAEVILLNEVDGNSWIDKVDPSWSGALPATLMYHKKNRKFFDKELTYQDINSSIQSLINP